MPKRRTLAYYRSLYGSMEILPPWAPRIPPILSRITSNFPQYSAATDGLRTHWTLLAIVHIMEASGSLFRNLFNGQLLDRTTTHAPRGIGPWPDWSTMARDWIDVHGSRLEAREATTSPSKILQFLERYNGWGYARLELNSPYIWSGSQHGIGQGKFVADGRYDPNAGSLQVGAALILRAIQSSELPL